MKITLNLLLAAVPFVLFAQSPYQQQGGKLVGTGYTRRPQFCPVATTSDGNLTIVGGPFDEEGAGAIWTFARVNGLWAQLGTKLTMPGTSKFSYFGERVALSADGSTAIAGSSGGLWAFTRANGMWVQQGGNLLSTFHGEIPRIALSADGNTALAASFYDSPTAPGELAPGVISVFTRTNGVWVQQAKMSGAPGEFLGNSIALSGDGNTALAQSRNGVWILRRTNGVWTKQGTLPAATGVVGKYPAVGYSLALSADGSTALLGDYGDNDTIGAAWVYTQTNGVWTQQGPKLVGTGAVGASYQGAAAALSADGSTAVVGGFTDDNYAGAVWVFTRAGGTWTQQGRKLVGTGAALYYGYGAEQGSCVAISGDGTSIIESGSSDNRTGTDSVGAVWVFTKPAATTFALSTSTPNATAGTLVTLTATVKTTNTNLAGPPVGTITFYENGVALPGSALPVDATGTVTYMASFPAGTHNLYASFIPVNASQTASGAPLTLNVSRAATQTGLTANLASAFTLNAAVSSAVVSPEITGSVQFMDVSTKAPLGSSQINKGGASLTLPAAVAASIGGHVLQAVYSGDANYASSTSGSVSIPLLVNAASGSGTLFAPGEFVSLFGAQLADGTAQAAPPLPTTLGGTTVVISDSKGSTRAAQLAYVSPSQVNLVVPEDVATGPASLMLRRGAATAFTLPINVSAVAPGIFSADASGRGPAAAQILRVHADGSQTVQSTASGIVLGDEPTYLVLYGTGIRNRSDLGNVTCRINGQSLPVVYAGAQGEFPGLDQVDVLLPPSLAGAGTVNVSLAADGATANTVTLQFR